MGRLQYHQIVLAALVASTFGAYWNIRSCVILLAFEGVAFVVCGYYAASDFLSKPREFVVQKLYRYGLWFCVAAMVGCFTEDIFAFAKRIRHGGSLLSTPLFDITSIIYLMQGVKRVELRLQTIRKKKRVASAVMPVQ